MARIAPPKVPQASSLGFGKMPEAGRFCSNPLKWYGSFKACYEAHRGQAYG